MVLRSHAPGTYGAKSSIRGGGYWTRRSCQMWGQYSPNRISLGIWAVARLVRTGRTQEDEFQNIMDRLSIMVQYLVAENVVRGVEGRSPERILALLNSETRPAAVSRRRTPLCRPALRWPRWRRRSSSSRASVYLMTAWVPSRPSVDVFALLAILKRAHLLVLVLQAQSTVPALLERFLSVCHISIGGTDTRACVAEHRQRIAIVSQRGDLPRPCRTSSWAVLPEVRPSPGATR